MKNRFFTLSLAAALCAGSAFAQSAPAAPAPVSPAATLPTTEVERLTLKLREATVKIAFLEGTLLRLQTEKQMTAAQEKYTKATQAIQQEVTAVKTAHNWGADVQYGPTPGTTQEQADSGDVDMVFLQATPATKPEAATPKQP